MARKEKDPEALDRAEVEEKARQGREAVAWVLRRLDVLEYLILFFALVLALIVVVGLLDVAAGPELALAVFDLAPDGTGGLAAAAGAAQPGFQPLRRDPDGLWSWKFDSNIFVPRRRDAAELLPHIRCRVALLRCEHGLVTHDIGLALAVCDRVLILLWAPSRAISHPRYATSTPHEDAAL